MISVDCIDGIREVKSLREIKIDWRISWNIVDRVVNADLEKESIFLAALPVNLKKPDSPKNVTKDDINRKKRWRSVVGPSNFADFCETYKDYNLYFGINPVPNDFPNKKPYAHNITRRRVLFLDIDLYHEDFTKGTPEKIIDIFREISGTVPICVNRSSTNGFAVFIRYEEDYAPEITRYLHDRFDYVDVKTHNLDRLARIPLSININHTPFFQARLIQDNIGSYSNFKTPDHLFNYVSENEKDDKTEFPERRIRKDKQTTDKSAYNIRECKDQNSWPRCVSGLFSKKTLSGFERRFLCAFLIQTNHNDREIKMMFMRFKDYDGAQTEYFIRYLRENKYYVPTCMNLRANKICTPITRAHRFCDPMLRKTNPLPENPMQFMSWLRGF